MPATPAVGPGRLLALVYAFFTLAAGARSASQVATNFAAAPLAFILSGVAAVIYAMGSVFMVVVERTPACDTWAKRLCTIEPAGVAIVGAASLAFPTAFPSATVWSGFGSGYAFVPIVLPVLGLAWLRHNPSRSHRSLVIG